MPKPALVTAGLEFVGTQPSVNDMTHQLSFQLKIGKNGHDATDGYLSIRSFVVNFARTQKQDTTKT